MHMVMSLRVMAVGAWTILRRPAQKLGPNRYDWQVRKST